MPRNADETCQVQILEEADVPFVVEIGEENSSLRPSPSPRVARESFRSNLTASLSSSTSSSFRCGAPSDAPSPFCQNAFLLNGVYNRRDSIVSIDNVPPQHPRRSSSRRSQQSQLSKSRRPSGSPSIGARRSSKRASTRSSGRRESRLSCVSAEWGEKGERRRSVHIPHHRRHSSTKRRTVSRQASLEQTKSRKKRTIACVILGTFLFILFCSVMAVVVTLTHRSKITKENKTVTYYTFSPDAEVIVLENKGIADMNRR